MRFGAIGNPSERRFESERACAVDAFLGSNVHVNKQVSVERHAEVVVGAVAKPLFYLRRVGRRAGDTGRGGGYFGIRAAREHPEAGFRPVPRRLAGSH